MMSMSKSAMFPGAPARWPVFWHRFAAAAILGVMSLPVAGQAPGAAAPPSPGALAPSVVPFVRQAEGGGAARPGQATRALLGLQRSGNAASPVARPLDGEVAGRSRQRYLKSFEREIPEHFGSSVTRKPSAP